MVIGTGISLWRYLAQSQVDSQTHAEAYCLLKLSQVLVSLYRRSGMVLHTAVRPDQHAPSTPKICWAGRSSKPALLQSTVYEMMLMRASASLQHFMLTGICTEYQQPCNKHDKGIAFGGKRHSFIITQLKAHCWAVTDAVVP